ncbi:ATP-dependent DNA helicase RecG [Fodinicurvata fenggangensis]|uniref:ATP-dependent DNA helicase RecG n=1 Tax=Fodinicurvata fenggangensis TaxID=1121830 RepID=UPI0004792024|nr:ATP-dependent DNA helicase RecG [Fodinicurvata fenggangensis]
MRPDILNPLFAETETLPGVGSRVAKLFAKLAGNKLIDLCWLLPSNVIDRRYRPKLQQAEPGHVATLKVTVAAHRPGANARHPYRIDCHDETGELELVFFHAREDYLKRILPIGETRLVSGNLDSFHGRLQMAHPDFILPPEEQARLPLVEAIYPLTAGLKPRVAANAIREAVQRAPDLPEWQDPAYLQRQGWTAWKASLQKAHHPENRENLSPLAPERSRLAYDELLSNQLALGIIRLNQKKLAGIGRKAPGHLAERAVSTLPFSLTHSQQVALGEIRADLADESRMLRLLQGDVGSGKTLVALLAMLDVVECGYQAALMAPTEILARQHYKTIQPLADAVGISTVILTGRDKGKARAALLEQLENGEAQLVIGTHALFQETIKFHSLGMAVIDEQHRFGVHQRLSLAGKGKAIDTLVMTATPIPRTLLLTSYGDMESSRLTEKPPGRQTVDTRTLPLERLPEVVQAVGRALSRGARVYWLCPLVEESETSDLAAAEQRFETLEQAFPGKVGLVHGRMKAAEKDEVMLAFSEGRLLVLVATTVIEVGVDVPEATVMVIEHAERFGLAQLHQLRGRVGRGSGKSTCLLLYQAPLGEVASERLRVLRESDDGFHIAEEDLKLRGSGEILGTRQSGFPEFRLADPAAHADLLMAARDDASLILQRDPQLESERGKALRVLLYLFERDSAVRYLRSG